MYTVNITTKVDNGFEEDWLEWQKNVHIPGLMDTACFESYRLYQLLEQDDTDGKIFVLQLVANTKENYGIFSNRYEHKFKNDSFLKWGEKCLEFRSLLQNID